MLSPYVFTVGVSLSHLIDLVSFVWLSKSRFESYNFTISLAQKIRSFKDFCDRSGLYNSDDPKRSWFLIIFFNLIEGLVGSK